MITEVYIFIGLYIFLGILCIYFCWRYIELKNETKLQRELTEGLYNIQTLEELTDVQYAMRQKIILIFANGDKEKYLELEKKYDIEKTKYLLYKFAEPIEMTLWQRIIGRLGIIFGF